MLKRISPKFIFATAALSFIISTPVRAEEPAAPEHDEVDVSKIKEKYWARGDESELGVVQNRLYSKSQKWSFGVLGGFTTTDPFLNVRQFGGSIGYNFNEVLSAHIIGWKSFVSKSSALETFEENLRASTNNNPPKYTVSAEARSSLIYGKLSLVGKSIIYYDFYFAGGMGVTGTDNGTYPSPSAGVGQKIYLSKSISFDVDYRLQYYRETIIEKVKPATMGQEVGKRHNWNNVINLGFTFLIGSTADDSVKPAADSAEKK